MSSVVLVTGVSRFLGGRLAAALAADPAVERVIGIDTVPPRTPDLPLLGRTEFVRADIRNPLVAKVIDRARVTTVVHAALMAAPRAAGGRVAMQEMNVIGAMQLLAAGQRSDTLERVVVRSTTAVYGAGPRDPGVFTEEMPPHDCGLAGYAKDAAEVEGYLRGFSRRRPDLELSVLRMAGIVGPTVDNAFTRYFAMPVVPTPLGFDARLQLLHEEDAVESLRLATVSSRPGIVNVAGEGVVTLSQAVRRVGRVRLPVPAAALGAAGALVGNGGAVEFTADDARFLCFGRVVDTTRLRERFGYRPRHTTAAALASLAGPSRRGLRPAAAAIDAGARLLDARRNGRRLAVATP